MDTHLPESECTETCADTAVAVAAEVRGLTGRAELEHMRDTYWANLAPCKVPLTRSFSCAMLAPTLAGLRGRLAPGAK